MNPLFQSYNQGKQPSFEQQLSNFAEQIKQMGTTPEMLGRQLIQNGRMSQVQFEQYRQIANQLTGKNY